MPPVFRCHNKHLIWKIKPGFIFIQVHVFPSLVMPSFIASSTGKQNVNNEQPPSPSTHAHLVSGTMAPHRHPSPSSQASKLQGRAWSLICLPLSPSPPPLSPRQSSPPPPLPTNHNHVSLTADTARSGTSGSSSRQLRATRALISPREALHRLQSTEHLWTRTLSD